MSTQNEMNNPPLNDIINGVRALQATAIKEIQYETDQTMLNLDQNLPFDHHVYTHGMISIHTDKSIAIPKGTLLRSFQSIYKTTHDAYVHAVKIVDAVTVNDFGLYSLRIRLEITTHTNLNEVQFFTSNETINSIFGQKTNIEVIGAFAEKLTITRQNPFNLFTNLNYNFLSYFTVRGITNTFGYVVIRIPLANPLNHVVITTNNIIVANQFETRANIVNGAVEQSANQNIIKVLSVSGDTEVIEPIYLNRNGWFAKRKNNLLFIHSLSPCKFATLECENKELNTEYCKFQELVPIRNASWKILPKKPILSAKITDYIRYVTGSPKYIMESLFTLSHIIYCSIEQKPTVLSTSINDQLVYSMGWALTVRLSEMNILIMEKIIEELTRYHVCQIKIIDSHNKEYLL